MVLAMLVGQIACIYPEPYVYKYTKITCDGAKQISWNRPYKKDPGVVIFPMDGVAISSSLTEGRLLLGFHIPKGHNAKLIDKRLLVSYGPDGNRKIKNFELVPVPLDDIEIKAWLKAPDPFGVEDYFGVMAGNTVKHGGILGKSVDKCYLFLSELGDAAKKNGDIELPEMVIDGRVVKGFKMSFKDDEKTLYRTPLRW